MTFQKILDKYRQISFSERDKGNRFERLMQAYLQTDAMYMYRFKHVWLWNEFPGRNDLGGGDTGIDLVALTVEGDYWAIQCKCFQDSSYIDKAAVDSFLSTSSREFKNEELQTVSFSHRLWISTTNKWSSNATEAIQNQNPPVSCLRLSDLQQSLVDWDKLEKGIHGEASRTPRKTLRPHQTEALQKTHEHFKTSDRGKLIRLAAPEKPLIRSALPKMKPTAKGLSFFWFLPLRSWGKPLGNGRLMPTSLSMPFAFVPTPKYRKRKPKMPTATPSAWWIWLCLLPPTLRRFCISSNLSIAPKTKE